MDEQHPPPPGYEFAAYLFADLETGEGDSWRFLIYANLLALIPLGVAALLIWLPYQIYAALGAPLALFDDPQWSPPLSWIIGLFIILGSMALHEGLHGVALWLRGYHAIFGFAMGYLYAGIQPGEFLPRRDYLFMVLTPLALISLIGAVMLPFLPASIGQIIVITLLLNAAASIGDLAVASRARRWPADTLFAASNGRISVYRPARR